jgi:hypothetical protein
MTRAEMLKSDSSHLDRLPGDGAIQVQRSEGAKKVCIVGASGKLKAIVKVFGRLARLARFADLDDQVEACRRVFASDTRWTVVRGSDLEEGESQGLPVWSRHVGDPILKSNLTRRVDFALFMVAAIENDELVHEAPAIVSCRTPSALAHAATQNRMTADSRRGA